MKLVDAKTMRELDRFAIEEVGIPGLILMENAGAGCAQIILENFDYCLSDSVAVVCGGGNNGGDGFVIARHLWNAGYDVQVFLIGSGERLKGDAAVNYEIAGNMGIPIDELNDNENDDGFFYELSDFGLIVDAVFGTGLDRDIKGFYAEVIGAINDASCPVFAVDIPSGLNSDTGKPMGTVILADVTVTFGFPKLGQWLHPGHLYCGDLYVVDISIPQEVAEEQDIPYNLIESGLILHMFMPRPSDSHKGDFGHALIAGGSPGITGAPVMAADAAAKTGAGLVTACCPAGLNSILEAKLTEPMTRPFGKSDDLFFSEAFAKEFLEFAIDKSVAAFGPGMGWNKDTSEFLKSVLGKIKCPVVLDADAVSIVSEDVSILKKMKSDVILTPHPGEMARLTGLTTDQIAEDRVKTARDFAVNHDVYIVLKGGRTIVATPSGEIYINPTGNPGMATGGSGDSLTGIIAGFLSQGWDALTSSIAGVFIHGVAGDAAEEEVGEKALTANDIIYALPEVLKGFEKVFDDDPEYD